MIKLIMFDFDGTLADTKNLYYTSIKDALKKEGVKFTEEQFVSLLGLKVLEIARAMGIKDELTLRRISDNVHSGVFSDIDRIKTASDTGDIRDISVRKIVVSNTDSGKVKRVLKRDKINFFEEVHGGDEFANKAEFIKDFIKDEGLKGNEVAYLGDMKKDAAVARDAGCISILINHKISWSSDKELIDAEPDFIITKFSDLQKIISRE